jgi:F-type H+-transporting ATPase subunit epsilon
MAISCRVVSPERPLFEGEVEHFVAPGSAGEIGVYTRHAPLIARLGPGIVRLHQADGNVEKLAVRSGFLQVRDDAATLLVSRAARPEDVDVAAAQKELAEVVEELQHPGTTERFEELLDRRLWLQTCLRVHG